MPLSTHGADLANNFLFTTTSVTRPTAWYAALFTTAGPYTRETTFAEVSGNGYARQSITFADAVNGDCASSLLVTFTASGGDWGDVYGFGIYDAETDGNQLAFELLDEGSPINIVDTQFIAIDVGGCIMSLPES